MRLLACLFISAALHALFFGLRSPTLAVPTLSLSLEPQIVALQIRTRTKRVEISPLEQKEDLSPPPPPPPPAPKPRKELKKLPPREAKPRPTPRREELQHTEVPKSREYVSTPKDEPRLIERAEYLSNPPPEYPEQARRRQQEGTVTLLVDIDSNGFVTKLRIQKSSGFSALDRATEKAVAKWKFSPATVGSRQVASRVIVPVLFKLNH